MCLGPHLLRREPDHAKACHIDVDIDIVEQMAKVMTGRRILHAQRIEGIAGVKVSHER